MRYRKLGNTGLSVSEIGLGGEWLEYRNEKEVIDIMEHCRKNGINIVDCWMANPNVRTNLGKGIEGHRDHWIIQGQIGSTWQNGQYERSRDMEQVKKGFEDLLERLGTDYIDLGVIHYVDEEKDYQLTFHGEFYDYVLSLKEQGRIKHIGVSTHNPAIGKKAVKEGKVEMILFSINPAYDMQPPTDVIDTYFADKYDAGLNKINPERAAFYSLCDEKGVGLTVMKGFAGGRLLNAQTSWFGVAMTTTQCIHYALTRPAVASVLTGVESCQQVDDVLKYETATDKEKDYTKVLSTAPYHSFVSACTYCGHCSPCPMDIDIAMVNKFYDLASMQNPVSASVKEHYRSLVRTADDCIGCGSCETRCPFGVRITERMVKAKELFGK